MQALRQFRSYPLQSVLIVLAIALGVAVVTAVLATLNGNVSQDDLTPRQISMQTKAYDWGAFFEGGRPLALREIGVKDEQPVSLTLEDMQAAKEYAPLVEYAYPFIGWNFFEVSLRSGGTTTLEMVPITKDYLEAANINIIQGSAFSDSEYSEKQNVILLPEATLTRLGIQGEPIGQMIDVTGFSGAETYRIVGIIEGKEHSAAGIPNIFVPYRLAPWEHEGIGGFHFVVKDKADVDEARSQLAAFASKTWGGKVTVTSPNDSGQENQQRFMTIVIAAFASTGLAAASLNVMNLMLARVLKRRHDIGIQRSLGATQNTILFNFLSESLLLGLLGGLLGTVAGYGLYAVYASYQALVYGDSFTQSPFPLLAIPLGFLVALVTSLIFGFYPAWQASRLRPVEALREI